jgi:hypothetical protein
METISYYKHPKTPHFPWSGYITEDDKVLTSVDHFIGKRVIATVKLDGENTSCYSDNYYHARSIDSKNHPSRNWCKSFLSSISMNIPKGWRISGENVYAEHTISYNGLETYFYAFAIWDENNCCLSWDEFVDWCALLGLIHVPVIYDGIWDEEQIKALYRPKFEGNTMEGYVVRIADCFHYDNFKESTAKYVSRNFRETLNSVDNKHWLEKHKMGIITNKLER